MTDPYYTHEDDVETPETQLDNFRAQMTATLAVETYVNSSIEGLKDQAEVIWNAAAERGDVDTQNRVVEMYNTATHLKDNVIYTNEAMKGVLAAAGKLAEQKQKSEAELGSLLEAIDNYDTNDPRLETFASSIEEGVYEFIAYNEDNSELFDEAFDEAHDSIVSDVYKAIKTFAPQMTYLAVERFFGTLKGDYAMNDIQRGLLLSLLATFAEEAKAAS